MIGRVLFGRGAAATTCVALVAGLAAAVVIALLGTLCAWAQTPPNQTPIYKVAVVAIGVPLVRDSAAGRINASIAKLRANGTFDSIEVKWGGTKS